MNYKEWAKEWERNKDRDRVEVWKEKGYKIGLYKDFDRDEWQKAGSPKMYLLLGEAHGYKAFVSTESSGVTLLDSKGRFVGFDSEIVVGPDGKVAAIEGYFTPDGHPALFVRKEEEK